MKREETFESTQTLSMSNSFGIVRAPEQVKIEVNIGIHESGDTGWFELYDLETGGDDWYAGGGLWFRGNTLVEYDGVFSLPKVVADKLEDWGYEIDL
jgi:hypothetical protein